MTGFLGDNLLALEFYFIFSLFGIFGYFFASKLQPLSIYVRYFIAKPLGLVFFAYPLWLLASLRIVKLNTPGLVAIVFVAAIAAGGYYIYKQIREGSLEFDKKDVWRIVVFEILSLALYFGYLYIRSFNARAEGTEKLFDMAQLSGAAKTDYFPYLDPWQGLKQVNYYYYGYYLYSLAANLARVPLAYAYNFSLGLIFSTSFMGVAAIVDEITKSKFFAWLSAALAMVAGNLHFALCYFNNFGPEVGSKCYYPTATRLYSTSYTINEIPTYSFTLGDLHPHLMALPFFVANLYLVWKIFKAEKISLPLLLITAFAMATSFMINTWDFIVLGLLILLLIIRKIWPGFRSIIFGAKAWLVKNWSWILGGMLLAAAPFILFLPFFASFKSPVMGVGFAPEFVVKNNLVGKAQYPSSAYLLLGVWGTFLLVYIIGFLITKVLRYKTAHSSFVQMLFLSSLVLVAFTELFYFKDIFHVTNPPYFRANTVFKLGFLAWVLAGAASGIILHAAWKSLAQMKGNLTRGYTRVVFVFIVLVISVICFVYPVQEVYQAYDPALPWKLGARSQTLDGSLFIRTQAPGDLAAINWLNANQKERVVVLETAGDSFKYNGRIAAFTGMMNPINWKVHEWTYRFHYPPGIVSWKQLVGKPAETGYGDIAKVADDVQKIYESTDTKETAKLLLKYNVKYVYVGPLERSSYSKLDESKFQTLGEEVMSADSSKLFAVYLSSL